MRRNDILIDKMEEIKILLQWFYMSEDNKIKIKGKFANTLLYGWTKTLNSGAEILCLRICLK